MDDVLSGLLWHECMVYLDDIIIFGKDFESTLRSLSHVFQRLKSAGLTMKPKKCELFRKRVLFLGHVVSKEGVECDPQKIEAVQSWQAPVNKTEVRQFIGLASYYRKFIENFSSLAAPLYHLTGKKVLFEWSEECGVAFEQLKAALTSPPVLSYPVPTAGHFILDTDASGVGMGAVLSQLQEGEERVIAYSSKVLSPTEQRYCTTHRELLAVRYFVEQFKPYLHGRRFLIRTDHASLCWLKNFRQIDGMLARWLSVLDTYDFELQHRKGVEHCNADAMSRTPRMKCKRDDCPDCGVEDAKEPYFLASVTVTGCPGC